MTDFNLESEKHIVIIGGGFTGAAVALNLFKIAPQIAIVVTIIEPRENLGAGLAYSTTDDGHRTNVPSSRFCILPDEAETLTAWLKDSGALDDDPQAAVDDGRLFPRRFAVGAYVAELLQSTSLCNQGRLRHKRARAVHVEKNIKNYLVTLDNNDVIEADILVIATGHPPPGMPPVLLPVANHKHFIVDPWRPAALSGVLQDSRVLIIGTALTAADVIITLNARGLKGKILAISRRGLLSREQVEVQTTPFGDFTTDPSQGASALLRRVRGAVKGAQAEGFSWASVIEALRAQGSVVWRALPAAEKRRFLRHLRPYWDVHRYQIAPQLTKIFKSRMNAGTLDMRGARIQSVSTGTEGFRVKLQNKTSSNRAVSTEIFDVIVNCTGPDHRNIIKTNPLLAALARTGLVRPDEFGLGLETDDRAHAINNAGRPQPAIFIAGPLARATFGELIGVAQIAKQARLIAGEIRSSLKEDSPIY